MPPPPWGIPLGTLDDRSWKVFLNWFIETAAGGSERRLLDHKYCTEAEDLHCNDDSDK
jgi:hypothetical protein